jgi:hypothetical protein
MASLISHPDKTHEATCFAAYQTWQQAVGGSPSQRRNPLRTGRITVL